MNLLEAAMRRDNDESARIVKAPSSWQSQIQFQSVQQQRNSTQYSKTEGKVAAKKTASTAQFTPKRRTYRKDTIIAMLRNDNESLRSQLEASKEENRRLRQLMATENETALNRNRALQLLVQQHLCQRQQSRAPQRGLVQQKTYSSSRKVQSTGNMVNDDMLLSLLWAKKRELQHPNPNDVAVQGLYQPSPQNQNKFTEQSVSSFVRPSRDANNLSFEAVLSSGSGAGNIQGTAGNVLSQGPSVSDQDTIEAELQLQRLEEELEALQRRLGSLRRR